MRPSTQPSTTKFATLSKSEIDSKAAMAREIREIKARDRSLNTLSTTSTSNKYASAKAHAAPCYSASRRQLLERIVTPKDKHSMTEIKDRYDPTEGGDTVDGDSSVKRSMSTE